MKVAIVTDTHAGARNDHPVFNEYFISFFEQQFIPFLKENNIKTVLHLGDIFDRRKFINFQTLNSWRERVFDVLQKEEINIIVTIGNHDVYYKNTNEVNSVNELLRTYSNIKIYSKPEVIDLDGLPICLLPWVPLGQEQEAIKYINSCKADICMGHLEIKGFEMHAGQVNNDHGFDQVAFDKFDMLLTGHFHHKSDNGHIYYLGAPYQMIWSDWKDPRGFHTFDTKTRDLLFYPNNKEIFIKISYNDENKNLEQIFDEYNFDSFNQMYIKIVVESKNDPYTYEKFLEKVYASNPSDVTIIDLQLDSISQEEVLDNAKDTLTILKEYVLTLDIKQKEELVNLMTNLYTEAVNLDLE